MKIGVGPLFELYALRMTPATYTAIAVKADSLGYESMWLGDHLLMPGEIPAAYLYTPNSRSPHAPDNHRVDVFVTFSHLAAQTRHIRFGTAVYILPLRNPFSTARAVATLDQFSGGRFTLGIGVGWMEKEFEIAGMEFKNRGARTDEIIQIMRQLWTRDVARFSGKHFSFDAVHFEPKPVQRPHPPIIVGGISAAALNRAARLGDGWMSAPNPETGKPHSPGEIKKLVHHLKQLRKEFGRDQKPFEVTVNAGGLVTLDAIRAYRDAGVDRVVVSPWGDRSKVEEIEPQRREQFMLEGLERFAEEVLPKIAT